MAELSPKKKDLEIIFRRLRSIPTNKICFDCTAKIPTWASITYGVFICIDCSAVHRSLGVHLSFVRSTQLDTNWTWLQIRQMQLGGNANAESFFQQHNCSTKDSQQKYNSRAAQLYKSKLQTAAVQAMKTHGTKLFLDRAIGQDIHQEESEKEYDFFEDHSFSKVINSDVVSVKPIDIENTKAEEKKAPSVNMNPSSLERQTIIGARKPQTKRSGIGNKKGLGFGAQKISTNFADVEREAVLAEKIKEAQKETEIDNNKKKKELDDDEIASMRLAYEDLSLKQKRETERLKINDPKKATQMERLGMGVGSRVGISHSALSDMKTIHQESSSKFNKMQDTEAHDFFDDFGISSSSSYSSVYKNASQSRMSLGTDDNEDTFKSLINSSFESSFTPQTSYNNNPKSQNNFNNTYKSHNNNVKKNASLPSEANTDAQKKFGAAKSISSDQYFSDSVDNTWEQKSNLSRFEGSTSISSADYFGRNENAHQRNYISSQLQAPDLEEVRESVKQSVNKVAGKLSSLASGVISSIQDKYGGY